MQILLNVSRRKASLTNEFTKFNPDKRFESASDALTFIQDQFVFRHQERLWFPSE
jgi:hypothetical protein